MPTLWEIESDYIRLLAELKRNGIKIDKELSKQKYEYGQGILSELQADLGWNPASTKQLGEFLLGEMRYPVLARTPKGNPKFDKHTLKDYEEMLEADGSDVAKKVIRYRGWQKTCSSNYKAYLELADNQSVIHPNYKPHGTVTGRSSCELPNLQQIPRSSSNEWNGDLKKAFIPRNEDLVSLWEVPPRFDFDHTSLIEFDYGQLETRLAAAVAEEFGLLEAFRKGEDVFQVMANQLNWERHNVKTFFYMTLYGAGVAKIAVVFGIDKNSATQMREEFYASYPKMRKVMRRATQVAKRQGYIEYWTGRRRHFYDDHHKAFNAYIQGGAYEIVKRSMLRLRRKTNFPFVLTVHDSVVLEIPTSQLTELALEEIRHVLEDVPEAPEMGVPFKVEYKEWGK